MVAKYNGVKRSHAISGSHADIATGLLVVDDTSSFVDVPCGTFVGIRSSVIGQRAVTTTVFLIHYLLIGFIRIIFKDSNSDISRIICAQIAKVLVCEV